MSSNPTPRLGPTWRSNNSGRGFQPPPAAVSDTTATKSHAGDATTSSSSPSANRNSFSLLDLDDASLTDGGGHDDDHNHDSQTQFSKKGSGAGSGSGGGSGGTSSNLMSRSEGLRSAGGFSARVSKLKGASGNSGSSSALGGGGSSGRSLADLASRFASGSSERGVGSSTAGGGGDGGVSGSSRRLHHNHHHHRNNNYDDNSKMSGGGHHHGQITNTSSTGNGRLSAKNADLMEKENTVVRFTRERLLGMRPNAKPGDYDNKDKEGEGNSILSLLTVIEGTSLFSKQPLDPVCWDNFDANEIWSKKNTKGSSGPHPAGPTSSSSDNANSWERVMSSERRGSMKHVNNDFGGADTWKRGVALPPEGSNRRGSNNYRYDDDNASNPEDLWDDPGSTLPTDALAAASDFSAFGGSLDDDPLSVNGGGGGGAFDLGHMSEAAKKFEEEFRRSKRSNSLVDIEDDLDNSEDNNFHAVNPTRPLASEGTTIRSGSGDHVSVFEDFEHPDLSETETPSSSTSANAKDSSNGTTIKVEDEQSASSRLMQMIGVSNNGHKKEDINDNDAEQKDTNPNSDLASAELLSTSTTSLFSFPSGGISKNPWGDPTPSSGNSKKESFGLDLAAKLRESSHDQPMGRQSDDVAADHMRREEMKRIQLMEEEAQRRASLLAQQQQQQQAELLLRQQHQQVATREPNKQVSQQGVSQVELILTERISAILENSWGRSDLMSVLSTLHNEDSRVIQLLGNVDALSALIARHPKRFALTKDPAFGTTVVVLLMNNLAWQQHQQADELRRRQDEHQKMLVARQQEAARIEAEKRAKDASTQAVVVTDSPWYYADPQGNVQGPFGGEEMRQWLEAGYFKGNLPISQDPNGQFRPLASLFPDISIAFKPTGPSKADLEALAKAEEEKRRAAAEAAERERREKEQLMKEKAKAEQEAAAAKAAQEALRSEQESQTNQKQSAQLKMMLGLGGDLSSKSSITPTEPMTSTARVQQTEQQLQSKVSKTKENKGNKSSNVSSTPAQSQTAPAPAQPPTPAWGGAATNKAPLQRKSMSEIQQEEARAAARLAKQKPQSSGWANIAASGGTSAWSGNATVISSSGSATVSSAGLAQSSTGVASRSKQSVSATSTQKAKNQTSTQKTMEEFGADGQMTPALETWCKDQMRKLNGSDDLTLIAFCMTLSDPVEIKGYLTAYLGSTSQVNNFATEFINRKNGTKQQEQWETTGGNKKGRKKKGSAATK